MSSRLASTSSGHNARISLYNFLDFSFVSASSAAGQRVVGARGGRLDLQHAGADYRAHRHPLPRGAPHTARVAPAGDAPVP